jgi:hypothetical protein
MTPFQGFEFFDFLNYLCLIWSPLPTKSAGACANLEDTTEGLCVEMRADMHITGDLLFMWDVLPIFRNIVPIAASQKTLILTL